MTAAARDAFGVFGTTAVLLVTEPAALGPARSLADAELAAVDLAGSRFRADSELTRLNQADGAARPVSPLLADLIATALRAAELTDGLVDPTCAPALARLGYDRDFRELSAGGAAAAPGPARPAAGWRNVDLDPDGPAVRLRQGAQLDLGATAKARAADRCAALIGAQLGCGVLVSLGGDLAVAGPPPPGGWRVRVTDDHAAGPEAPGQTVAVDGGGLATSSTTVRTWIAGGRPVHHIIDPRTGEAARSCWRTVSVTAGSCTDANIASTAAIVLSESAPAWLARHGLPARLVQAGGTVLTVAGWPADDQAVPATDGADGADTIAGAPG